MNGGDKEKKYLLSYGGGVNSTAILALIKQGKLHYPNLRIIMADPGAEKPETYCYINDMRKHFDIEIVKSKHGSIIDYCKRKKVIPFRMLRWCTGEFKVKPIKKWEKENGWYEAITIMGFASDESKRARNFNNVEYPLIDLGINREECKAIIREVGWDVPVKSGCYICPFARKLEWIAMMHNSPELFKVAVELEANSPGTYHGEKSLLEWLGDEKDQSRIMDFEDYQHCLCAVD